MDSFQETYNDPVFFGGSGGGGKRGGRLGRAIFPNLKVQSI